MGWRMDLKEFGFEKDELFLLFKSLIGDLNEIFSFRGVKFGCRFKDRREGLVVDVLAYYEPNRKEICVCGRNLRNALTTYGLGEGCARLFMLYVLLHEFIHYTIDYLGFHPRLTRLPDTARFDEPFSEYIALRSCVEGRLRVFGSSIMELPVKEDEKRCIPLFSSLSRPVPYSYFNCLYASRENLLNISAEATFLMFVKMLSRITAVNPDPLILSRMLLMGSPMESSSNEDKPYAKLIQKIPAVGVLWCV